MTRTRLPIVLTLLFAGCASLPEPHSRYTTNDLLDGRALFGETVSVDEAGAVDMLEVSPEMRRFLDERVSWGIDRLRLEQLLRGMKSEGYFEVIYDSSATLTAGETFRRRNGNCLSYTNLFIALARAAGLDARYEIVRVPPIWDSADDWVILNNHINAIVRGVKVGALYRHDFIVDFNTADYNGPFGRRVISDRSAAALFHSNRGAEALRAGEFRVAFANFKRAVEYDSHSPSVWVNLGALYSRRAQPERAAAAYERAIAVEPSNKPALMSLARLYEQRGDQLLAEQYRQRISHYEDINPYYHYWRAQNAYLAADYSQALEQIERAISLKQNAHELYFLEGLIHYRAGDIPAARASLAQAERYSGDAALKQRYSEKLAVLARGSTSQN